MDESKFYRLIKPLIPKPLRPLALRFQEVLSYLVFGALTTLVNFLVYFPLSNWIHYLAANIIAWICAVSFAFVVNKVFVFEDSRRDAGYLLRQMGAFAAMRLVSLGMEELLMFVFIEKLGMNANLVKLAAQVIVIVLNYVFSKLLIFRKKSCS